MRPGGRMYGASGLRDPKPARQCWRGHRLRRGEAFWATEPVENSGELEPDTVLLAELSYSVFKRQHGVRKGRKNNQEIASNQCLCGCASIFSKKCGLLGRGESRGRRPKGGELRESTAQISPTSLRCSPDRAHPCDPLRL